MKNYSLQTYKGVATRHTCPNCGDKRSFAYYVDEENTPLHPSVGRCNHESSCGYHYTPKQYFQDHPECRTSDAFSFDGQKRDAKSKSTPTEPLKPTTIGNVPIHYVEKSKSKQSNFFRFLSTLLGNYYGSKSQEVLNRLLDEYRLGATREGAVIFWQLDKNGKVRTPMIAHDDSVNGYFSYLTTVRKDGEHGNVFGYRTVNADALGWVVSKITGKSVAALLTEYIWNRMGMEQDAYYQVDALGIPFAGGGLNASLRDLARVGEMLRNNGMWRGVRIIPAEAVEDIRHGGSVQAFERSEAGKSLKGWSYRDMWWVTNNAHGAYMARGVHGQAIYVDPVAEMVIVRLASTYLASNLLIDPLSLPAYEAVAEYLIRGNN